MSKKIHQVKKKLNKAKNAGEALRILEKLKATDPETYRKLQEEPGN